MGGCCCCCSRADDYNDGGSGGCCTHCCCPPCLGCCCGMCASNTEEQDSSSSVQDVRYVRTVCDGLGAGNDRSGPIQGRGAQNISGNTDEGEGEALAAFKNLKCAEFKNQGIDDKPTAPGTCQVSKLSEMVILTDEEDTCPTCLEGYDKENPRIITKCDHHFHLACILEWMERSDNCPICDQEMIFKEKSLVI